MPQHQNQRRVKMVHRIFNTAEIACRHYIAGHAYDEQVTEPLIEQQLRRNSRIAAAEDSCERVLPGDQLFSPGKAFMPATGTGGSESFIPLQQKSERFAGVSGCGLFGLRLCIALSG